MKTPTPPHNADEERSVLGAVLLDNAALDRIPDLEPDDFYVPAHKLIFSTMRELSATGTPIDEITTRGHLKSQHQLAEAGGWELLAALSAGTPTSAHVLAYGASVRANALRRRYITVGSAIVADAQSGQGPVVELVDRCEAMVGAVASSKTAPAVSLKSALVAGFTRIQDAGQRRGELIGIPTGLTEIDRLTGGLRDDHLIVLAGRPGMGKSALMMNIVTNSAINHAKVWVVFSLEMPTEDLVNRILAQHARINLSNIERGNLTATEWVTMSQTAGRIHDAKVFFEESAAASVMQVRSACRRIKREHGLDGVAIDYLQLMVGKGDNETEVISNISRGLKGLARELHVPVIALSQLNRGLEQRTNKRPMMADLRGSGSIEQDADEIGFLYRDEYYNHASEDKGVAELHLAKQRNGATGICKLAFVPHFTTFANMEHDDATPHRTPSSGNGYDPNAHTESRGSA